MTTGVSPGPPGPSPRASPRAIQNHPNHTQFHNQKATLTLLRRGSSQTIRMQTTMPAGMAPLMKRLGTGKPAMVLPSVTFRQAPATDEIAPAHPVHPAQNLMLRATTGEREKEEVSILLLILLN